MGICRLYPLIQNKHESDWCGQFEPVQREIMSLSVYDMPKKLGRPKKNV
jgi:hypothetical protein